jgi:hypothetical protein
MERDFIDGIWKQLIFTPSTIREAAFVKRTGQRPRIHMRFPGFVFLPLLVKDPLNSVCKGVFLPLIGEQSTSRHSLLSNVAIRCVHHYSAT